MCQWTVPLLQFTLKIKIGVFWSRWGTKTATSWDPQKDWQVKWRVLIWVFVASVEQSYFFENTSVTIFPLFFAILTCPATDTGNPADHYKHQSSVAVLPALIRKQWQFHGKCAEAWHARRACAHMRAHTHNLKQFKNIFEIFTQAFFTPKKNPQLFFKLKVLRHEKQECTSTLQQTNTYNSGHHVPTRATDALLYRPHLEGKKRRESFSAQWQSAICTWKKKDIVAVHKKLDSITHANEASEVSRLITSMILMPPVATLQLKTVKHLGWRVVLVQFAMSWWILLSLAVLVLSFSTKTTHSMLQ